MSYITSFRGVAGEMVFKFITPQNLVTVFGLTVVWGLLVMLLGFFAAMVGPYIPGLVFLFLFAWFTGRFAIPVAQGQFDEGLLTTKIEPMDTVAFAVRYVFVLLMVWIPLYFAAKFVIGQMASGMMVMGMGGFSPEMLVHGGVWGIVMLALLVIFLLSPTTVLLVATCSSSIGEALTPEPWLWVLGTRFRDYVVHFSSCFGGIMVFYCLYFFPLALIAALLMLVSPEVGAIAFTCVYFMPAAASPILLGRLSGAFVFGTKDIEGWQTSTPQIPKAEDILAEIEQQQEPDQEGETIKGLGRDPSDEFLAQIKEELTGHDDVESAFLFEVTDAAGSSVVTIGLELSADAKLGSRQAIQKQLREKAAEAAGGEVKVMLLHEDISQQVEEMGLRIYRKK